MLGKKLQGTTAAAAGWNLANASYTGAPVDFVVLNSNSNLSGLFIGNNGTKLYVTDNSTDEVDEYNLSTAWEISTASYVQSFSVATQDTGPQGLFFKPDGTKMYVVGGAGQDINEYDLSSAWNISTASYLQNFSVATEETAPRDLFFKPDGTKMYVIGTTGDDVNEYNLSTAWDISTASYLQNFSVAAQETTPSGLFFKPDGTKMYVIGSAGDDVNEYNLSSAWNISTASYVQNFSVLTQVANPISVFFKDDGTKMYAAGTSVTGVAFSYDLSSAWNISTASFTYPSSNYLSLGTSETTPSGVFFKPDGTKLYVLDDNNNDVNEYDLSSAWNISTASYLQSFSVTTQESNPSSIFFKPDGTKMYVLGFSGDDVNEYNLSSAWNISTASYLQNFSVAAQETNPAGLFFKPDGTKMYVIGYTGDDVNEYDLSSAWNISTASYLQNFSVASQDVFPTGVFFKDDGTEMYITGRTNMSVYQYSLATAWNVSTASFTQSFSVTNFTNRLQDLFIKPDGKKLYIVSETPEKLNSIVSFNM